MRTVLIIGAVIALLLTAIGSTMLFLRNGNEAQGMEMLEAMPGGGLAKGLASKMLAGQELPSAGAFKTAGMLSLLLAGFAVFGIVATFLKKPILGKVAPGLLALGAILLFVLQPSLDGGSLGGANPKTLAMIMAAFALVGAGCVFGVHQQNSKA